MKPIIYLLTDRLSEMKEISSESHNGAEAHELKLLTQSEPCLTARGRPGIGPLGISASVALGEKDRTNVRNGLESEDCQEKHAVHVHAEKSHEVSAAHHGTAQGRTSCQSKRHK